ncbi:MAG TPA: nitronate monooxygenase [Acidimicrobiales bacterium]|jgi:nitronate monooxygenase|nr:nitronate monooxygenase [Acidimicrobiales bacterium]
MSNDDDLESFGRRARELFGIRLPVLLGPMAGGPSTPELVAAVSNAGGLGCLGGGYLGPERLRHDIRAVRGSTDQPFAVNLFAPEEVTADDDSIKRAREVLAPYRRELGLEGDAAPTRYAEDFSEQLDVVVDESVPIFSVTFGLLPAGALRALHEVGTLVGGTATTVAEARALQESGVDFICAQGAEAGGHRGSFLSASGDNLVGLVALVPQVCDAVEVPVVAAGGIGDGRGVAAALMLGACAAQLGTAYLLCPEAGTSQPYRDAIRHAGADETVITSAFSGRRARGIVNRLAQELAGRNDLPGYPVLNALTRDVRQRAVELDRAEFLSLWAGQAVGLARELPAGRLTAVLEEESRQAIARRPAVGSSSLSWRAGS